MDVTGSGSDVEFTFQNTDSLASSLTNIYWDLGSSADAYVELNYGSASDGVDFLRKGSLIASSPSDLPGGASVGFSTDFAIQADSKGGKPHNGVNGGEFLTLSLTLSDGYDATWLLSALDSGNARVGVHVLSLEGGFSASGVSTAATPIPGSVWILGSGLLGLLGLRRIRQHC